MTIFRPAQESDLAPSFHVVYENEMRSVSQPPPPGDIPAEMYQTFRTGTFYVAEDNDHILAFAAAITRSQITFLTDLFVRPNQQSAHLGKALLQHVMPQDSLIHCTMSSMDPRAHALYIRSGMQPQWPNYCLLLNRPLHQELPTADIHIVEGPVDDPQFMRWDAEISGRHRPQDHSFWIREQRSVPLWLERNGERIGYAYVRLGSGSFGYPQACTLGPIGATTPQDATACVLATVNWARQHTPVLRIDVPGPHPCLAPLLAAGFHITYVETFVSSASAPFFDPRCYIASGSTLF